MNRKLTIAFVAAAVAGIASPAFAQVHSAGYGTGNVLPFRYPVEHVTKRAAHVRRVHADVYAMAPNSESFGVYADSPAANGGGSLGYNQVLRQPN